MIAKYTSFRVVVTIAAAAAVSAAKNINGVGKLPVEGLYEHRVTSGLTFLSISQTRAP